ncbi:MAG: HAD family hydrolase [Thermomicrobiaceae bacterium]
MYLVTLDFHNTLFQCDAWFRLEVETLPVAVMQHPGAGLSASTIRVLKDTALQQYREIRQEAMSSGIECDAVTSVQRVFQNLELDLAPQSIEELVRQIMFETVVYANPLPGATELVGQLYDDGVPLAVVSSAAYHPFLQWCLERFNMRDAFHHVVTSAACGIYKSNPAIYTHTLELFQQQPESAVHIGDSHRFDVTSASSVGMKTILLSEDIDQDLDPAPEAIIRSLGDAGPHLDRLLGS